MSTSFTPSHDPTFRADLAQLTPPFTTFQNGHFVKPAATAQPIATHEDSDDLLTFEGEYSELYVTAALDLDYDEPNAVVEEEVQFVPAGPAVHAIELPVVQVSEVAEVEKTEAIKPSSEPIRSRHAA